MKPVGVYAGLDTTFEIRASGELAEVVRSAYADLLAPPGTRPRHVVEARRRRGGRWTIAVDREPTAVAADASRALRELARAADDLVARSARATDTVLNGSAIEFSNGTALLVGPPRSGKSAVAFAAVHRGHGFIADEVVALDSESKVRAYLRPLWLPRTEADALGLAVPDGPFDIGYPVRLGAGATVAGSRPLRFIVVVQRSLDEVGTAPLLPAQALARIASHSLRVPEHDRAAFRRLTALVQEVPVILLSFLDVSTGAALLDALSIE